MMLWGIAFPNSQKNSLDNTPEQHTVIDGNNNDATSEGKTVQKPKKGMDA